MPDPPTSTRLTHWWTPAPPAAPHTTPRLPEVDEQFVQRIMEAGALLQAPLPPSERYGATARAVEQLQHHLRGWPLTMLRRLAATACLHALPPLQQYTEQHLILMDEEWTRSDDVPLADLLDAVLMTPAVVLQSDQLPPISPPVQMVQPPVSFAPPEDGYTLLFMFFPFPAQASQERYDMYLRATRTVDAVYHLYRLFVLPPHDTDAYAAEAAALSVQAAADAVTLRDTDARRRLAETIWREFAARYPLEAMPHRSRDIGARVPDTEQTSLHRRLADHANQARAFIEAVDPAPGDKRPKYFRWLLSLFESGQLPHHNPMEDAPTIRRMLERLAEVRRLNRMKQLARIIGVSDINTARANGKHVTRHELSTAIDEVLGRTQQAIELQAQVEKQNAELLFRDNLFEIIQLHQPKAASVLCDGTDWCVTAHDVAEQYLKQGNLLLFRRYDTKAGGYVAHAMLHVIEGWQWLPKDVDDTEIIDRDAIIAGIEFSLTNNQSLIPQLVYPDWEDSDVMAVKQDAEELNPYLCWAVRFAPAVRHAHPRQYLAALLNPKKAPTVDAIGGSVDRLVDRLRVATTRWNGIWLEPEADGLIRWSRDRKTSSILLIGAWTEAYASHYDRQSQSGIPTVFARALERVRSAASDMADGIAVDERATSLTTAQLRELRAAVQAARERGQGMWDIRADLGVAVTSARVLLYRKAAWYDALEAICDSWLIQLDARTKQRVSGLQALLFPDPDEEAARRRFVDFQQAAGIMAVYDPHKQVPFLEQHAREVLVPQLITAVIWLFFLESVERLDITPGNADWPTIERAYRTAQQPTEMTTPTR